MTKQADWLTQVANDLAQDKLQYQPNDEVIMEPGITDIGHLKGDVQLQNEAADPKKLNKVHLFKHLNKRTQATVDMVLSRKYLFYNNTIITDNKILERFQADYHVVLLDATADYIRHYLINDMDESTHLLGELFNYPTVNVVLQCLLFVKNDHTYFLALPCFFSKTEVAGSKNINLDILDISYQQLQELLKPIPLLEVAGFKPLRLVIGMRTESLEHNYDRDQPHFFGFRYENTYQDKTSNAWQKYNDYLHSAFITNKKMAKDCIEILDDLASKNMALIINYLRDHLKVETNKTNGLKIYLVPNSTEWTEYFKKHPNLLNGDDGAFFDAEQTDNMKDCPKSLNRKNFTDLIKYILYFLFLRNLDIQEVKQPKVETLTTNDNKLQALVQPDKTNSLFMSLIPGDSHGYYAYNNKLLTLKRDSDKNDEYLWEVVDLNEQTK